MDRFDQSVLEEQLKAQRATVFRVYNYYRVLISFLFLFLFLDPNLNEFVGSVNPELFSITIVTYIVANVIIGVATLFVSVNTLSKTASAMVILIGDIIALTLLMSASGGVSSGLGNFLFFSLAFGGGLVYGRVSTVLPAIAFILTIYDEFYLFFLDENDIQSFFQAGLLGIVYFVTNILFQTLSQQLRTRQQEVHTLEQINQLVIESMRTGVVVLTASNQPRFINKAAERYLSTPDLAQSPRDVLPDALLNLVAGWRGSPTSSDLSFPIGDSALELVANISQLDSATDESDILIFLEDSTDVQRQAQQLKLASLGRLSASIAHEIRNPLGAISHAAQLLSESTDLDTGDKRLCEIVQDQSVRMNGVIENVLQMSRRRAPEKVELLLSDWLNEFVDEFAAGEERSEIEVELDSEVETVSADPLHLSQVLGNLCQNGLRYSKSKTGESRVKIKVGWDSLTEQPYLDVIDYGEGVSEENIDSLFEPFYTTETTGTGLGLYLSRELCIANDARLNYRVADTGGAAFRISFIS